VLNNPPRSGFRAGAVVGLLVALALAGAATAVGWRLLDVGGTQEIDRTSPAVLQALQDMARFKAASGTFQVVVDIEEDVKLLPDFVAGERTLMVATGTVDAEVDLANLDADAVEVSPDRTKVTIRLPAATLTPARIDNEKSYVAARSRGLVNRVGDAFGSDPGDDSPLYQRAETQLEQAAAETDLQVKAEENTTAMLTELMQSLGFTEVEIIYEEPEP
jgi:hypothetical protein